LPRSLATGSVDLGGTACWGGREGAGMTAQASMLPSLPRGDRHPGRLCHRAGVRHPVRDRAQAE
jgi:hypothetical protein